MIYEDNKNYCFKIGENATENWLIYDDSDLNYIFIHVLDLPSAHGVLYIKNNKN